MLNKTLEKARDAYSYIYRKKVNLDFKDFNYKVEVKFIDAQMEINHATVEKVDDFVFVFAEHYPPFFQHVDETESFAEYDYDGNELKELKSWKNPDY